MIRRRNSIDGQFAPHSIEMIKSPAWSVLSLSARRVLDRIEIEHADHGGNENGRLPVTYDDFERYGIHRHAIRAAIQETVALGFAEITERGRAGNAEFRSPHKFRLTYFHVGRAPPTNEWQRIKTVEEAQALGKAARLEAPQKTKDQWRKTPNLSGGNRHRKRQFHSAETASSVRIPPLLLYLGGRASQTDRQWPRAGRAAAPNTAKGRGGRAKKPAQTPPTSNTTDNDATQSSSIKEVLDALAPIAVDIRTNEQGSE